mmetsp:Transcript_12973/g.28178  ORF Transcript_12973/g.28178 Transcript_12973/m.28178 type:complete len:103 (-) Transcript_12973:430-738(-)
MMHHLQGCKSNHKMKEENKQMKKEKTKREGEESSHIMTSAQGCARHGRIYRLTISPTLSRALACVTWQCLSGVRFRKQTGTTHHDRRRRRIQRRHRWQPAAT